MEQGLPGAGKRRKGQQLFDGYRVSVLQDENVLETWCTATWTYWTLLNCTFPNGEFCIFYHNLKKNQSPTKYKKGEVLSLDLQSFLVHLAEYGFAPMLSWNADLLYWPNPNPGRVPVLHQADPGTKTWPAYPGDYPHKIWTKDSTSGLITSFFPLFSSYIQDSNSTDKPPPSDCGRETMTFQWESTCKQRPLWERPNQVQLLKISRINEYDPQVYPQYELVFYPWSQWTLTTMRSYFILFIHYLFRVCLPHQNICSVTAIILSVWLTTGSTETSVAIVGA